MKTDLPQRTFAFSVRIVRLCQVLDRKGSVGRTVGRQLIRSGTSIGANVEEGQASPSRADFRLKYSFACKEARESQYWLRLLAETGILPAEQLEPITQECSELVAILTTILKRSRSKSE